MRISIIGGGIGGLCLAQGLLKSGIPATVHESGHRPQGWRVTIKNEGTAALRACLPEELFDRVLASAIRPATRMVFMDHQLVPKFDKPIPPVEGHFGISRQVLRDLLLTGLDVRFGKTCVGYSGTTAHFADGTSAEADLIVGADGTDSTVRARLLPYARLDDLGTCLYGVTPFTTLDWVPDVLVDTFNRITEPGGAAMAVATCRPGDYFTWTLTGDPGRLDDWHPAPRRIVEEATITFPVRLRSALPVQPWDDPHVTLLGDAAHTMTPGRGDGANTALRDARLLTLALQEAAAGRVPPAAAKALYEEEMLRYGFAAVEAARNHPFAPR
ncbi:FAD-dependent oxidoreductase [Nonomuraea sediminis]|uniref:FAD-dependent oxidoreductase n=1 Tax=Nonomuraea sediminis TaxID=2835864 RepID=UPI001BDC1A0A|nr:NAD(P)/FAD-dependent oxidoreductase [Nonomuraea sediminis]